MARANEQLAALTAAGETLVIFQGPRAYVTPSWYPSKQEHGKVVPTWNYVVVQAWGRPQVIEDAGWLRTQIAELTVTQETERAHPWAVADAPSSYIDSQL